MSTGHIRRMPTSRGLQSLLTYWYHGQRYRPVLGYNLSADQERDAAQQIIRAIHSNVPARGPAPEPARMDLEGAELTFAGFVPTYLAYLHTKRRDHDGRNETILDRHLIPHFGSLRLGAIRLEDGLAYVERRRAQKTAEGTIERECAVLMAVLNLAVDMDALDKNRLRRLPIPQYQKRERVLQAWELLKLVAAASPDVWRLMLVALQTGLRVNKLIEIHSEWLVERGDGWWLVPAPGRSPIKGVPKAVPLTALALSALRGTGPRIAGRPFERWKDGNSFKHRWQDTCTRAGVHDLHFHDCGIPLRLGSIRRGRTTS